MESKKMSIFTPSRLIFYISAAIFTGLIVGILFSIAIIEKIQASYGLFSGF
jgi:hypothetical protein